MPVVSNLGPVVTSLGTTVAGGGRRRNDRRFGGQQSRWEACSAACGGGTGGTNPLAPLTGLLGGAAGGSLYPLAPVTGLLGGGRPAANPLAPVTNLLSGATSAAGGASGSSNPLALMHQFVAGRRLAAWRTEQYLSVLLKVRGRVPVARASFLPGQKWGAFRLAPRINGKPIRIIDLVLGSLGDFH
ncbi:hypothetical protein ACU4HD_44230 [Cupriavidus basilensis]